MSFFFKSKKNTPPSGLPQSTRNLKSADGALPPMSSLSGMSGNPPPRPDFRVLTPVQNGALRETVSEKTSLDRSGSRLTERDNAKLAKSPSPDQKPNRERADSEPRQLPPSKIAQPAPPSQASIPTPRPAADQSPYPWSQRQLTYNVPNSYPFPRYGAAVNAIASRDGTLYIMGGLINGSTVKGDLWTIEAGTSQLTCYPVQTTAEGPGPRVGHASLLVGNAFIVFGGDTKTEETDLLDDTLYLLNTSTKQWSRAAPAGIRPPGRYGHTLNILGSKIYIFGGQVEGFFFNDLVAFDLNALQQASNTWEVLIQNTMDGGPPPGQVPPPRTNHSMVTWNDRLYLFGGTDGVTWFNDVWAYEGRTNSWSQLECIGYIPAAREGHAAALVGDVMYVFGGRTEEGNDLGDLAAFKITSRRWYTFQNMGPSPSPRSGHSMTTIGKTIVVLAGEPSSAPRDAGELSLAYFLDTTKIRYPVDSAAQQTAQQVEKPNGVKKIAEKSGIPQSRNATPRQIEQASPTPKESPGPLLTNGDTGPASRLPRSTGPQAATALSLQNPNNPYATQVDGVDRPSSPIADEVRNFPQPRSAADAVPAKARVNGVAQDDRARTGSPAMRNAPPQHAGKPSTDSLEPAQPRAASRQKKPPTLEQETPRASLERVTSNGRRTASKERFERDNPPVDSGVGSSPAIVQQHDTLLKQLEAERNKNAWYTSELNLARRAGYAPSRSDSAGDDSRSSTVVGEADRPLIEALLRMRGELQRMQQAMEMKAQSTAERIAQTEKQRDAAINEATFAKARYAAQRGEHGKAHGTNASDVRGHDFNNRLASALAAQTELKKQIDMLTRERDAEKRARELAEDGVDAHHKRITDLDTERQRTGGELESTRAELHEAQRLARDEAARSAEAVATHQLLLVDKTELSSKLETALAQVTNHEPIMATLHQAVTASSDKATLLETQLENERAARNQLESKLVQLKSQHEERTAELETTSRQLRDAEELADKHATEAKTHRLAVLDGFTRMRSGNENEKALTDKRVLVLHEQVTAANAMVRANQLAADAASEKLRRAEERIAGLEAYQEQSSREGLNIRKQMQSAMKEMRSLGEEKARLQAQLQSQQLETNAIHVQHSALKDVLTERGINATELRKNRLGDSPTALNRHGSATPETPRLRELQDQLENSHRAHEELRARLDDVEDRDATTRKEYEDKLTALDNDHQAAAKYLRGTEKMLSKMKAELQRVKQQSNEYLEELEKLRSKSATNAATDRSIPSDWKAERAQLQRDIAEAKSGLTSSMVPLESKIAALQADLLVRDTDLKSLRSGHSAAQSDLEALRATHVASRTDIDRLRRENISLEERARDAESKVQMLLDQVETSVDNYRRQTADLTGLKNAAALHAKGAGEASQDRAASAASSSNAAPPGGFDFGQAASAAHTRDHSIAYSTATSASYTSGETETDDVSEGNVIGAFPQSRESAARPPPLNTGVSKAGGLSVAPAPLNATERNSEALNSLADELDGLRYRLSGRFDFEPLRTPTKITGGFHMPTGSNASTGGLAEWRRNLEKKGVAAEEDDDEEEEEGGFYPGRLTAMSTGSNRNLRAAAKVHEGEATAAPNAA